MHRHALGSPCPSINEKNSPFCRAKQCMKSLKFTNRRTVVAILVVVVACALTAWWITSRQSHAARTAAAGSRINYYQCPMHPWVKSDKPGKCTVCGMDLVTVYQNAQLSQPTTDIVMLPPGAPNVAGIKTVEVQRRRLARTLRVAGTIDDDESRHRILSAYTGGRVEKLFVNYEGAEVKEGQRLATFYSKDLLNAVREYKVAFKQGPSPLLTAAEMRLQQLGMSKAQIARAPERSEADIFVEILAPVTGTVVKRYVYEGQYVQE